MTDTLLAVVLFPAAFVTFILAALTWSRRNSSTAASALAVLLLSLGIWNLAYGLRTVQAPAPSPHLWLGVMYIGVATAPTALLVFALHFARLERWLTKPVRLTLLLEPAFILLAAWTDSRYGLLFHGSTGGDRELRDNAGPAFWVNLAYSYLLMAVSTVVLLRHRWSHRHRIYRRQAAAVLVGVAVPWAGSALLALHATQRDMTPLSVSVAAFAFGYSILRFRMLEVAPIARDLVIERMSDGVLVIDGFGTISDLNPMARRLLAIDDPEAIGKHFIECLADQPQLTALLNHKEPGRIEIRQGGMPPRCLDISVSVLEDRGHRAIGALALIRDMSERKLLESELERLAGLDPLTGIGNRRSFDDEAARALKLYNRTGLPLSIVLLDVDHLKLVNDREGHEAGDHALQHLATVLQRRLRAVDVAARIGGDEFALLLPNTTARSAANAVERIRHELRARVETDDRIRIVSISAGIAQTSGQSDSVEELMRLADAALYKAKADGRDCVRVAEDPHSIATVDD